jgi:hypothetical protein
MSFRPRFIVHVCRKSSVTSQRPSSDGSQKSETLPPPRKTKRHANLERGWVGAGQLSRASSLSSNASHDKHGPKSSR